MRLCLVLKWVDATPILKKGQHREKDNFRPVSILTQHIETI